MPLKVQLDRHTLPQPGSEEPPLLPTAHIEAVAEDVARLQGKPAHGRRCPTGGQGQRPGVRVPPQDAEAVSREEAGGAGPGHAAVQRGGVVVAPPKAKIKTVKVLTPQNPDSAPTPCHGAPPD